MLRWVSGGVVLGLVGWRGFCRVRGRGPRPPPRRGATGGGGGGRRARARGRGGGGGGGGAGPRPPPPAGAGAPNHPLQALKAEKSCLLDCEYGMVNTAEGVMAKQSLVFSVKMMITPHNRHPL